MVTSATFQKEEYSCINMSDLSKVHQISSWNCEISVTVLCVLWQYKVQIFIIVEDRSKNWALGNVRQEPQCFGLGETVLHHEKCDSELQDTNWQPTDIFCWNWFRKNNLLNFTEKYKKMYYWKICEHLSIREVGEGD